MIGTCKLNNKTMRNIRRDSVYQCIAIDLAMLGVLSKEECEMLIGGGIPKNLTLPNGKQGNIISESDLTKNDGPTDDGPTDDGLINGVLIEDGLIDEE